MKKLMVLILTVFFLAGMTGNAAAYIYADSHVYTPETQPPRYWQVGVSEKPPPSGVHPEYAEGAPDGWLTGWSPEIGELILGFSCDYGLKNVEGDDLTIWHFGKPDVANVYVSTDAAAPSTWDLLGALSGAAFGTVVAQTFDFGSLVDGVHFVKIDKFSDGYGTGHFIDAVAGAQCVPIPGAVWLFGSGLVAFFGLRRRSDGRMISDR